MFRALADPTRRSLLDELFREDGQTLSALEERFAMTRFGVMKHLKQLEEAGLVVTRRRGREKLHFLNPVPIRLVHDRWVSKYAEPWAAALSGLKHQTGESDGEGLRDLHPDHARSGSGRRSPTPRSGASTTSAPASTRTGRPAPRFEMSAGDGAVPARRGRDPRGRPAAPAGPDHDGALERRGEERRHVEGHVGDRAGRRLVPPDASPTTSCARARTTSSTAAGR